MKDARDRERTCQEASSLSHGFLVPCGAVASYIVDNGDEHPYWMCAACATHNSKNRRAVVFVPLLLKPTSSERSPNGWV
jgi:hypothetical protein